MKVLFNFCHPAHIHLFKNAIKILQNNGNQCKLTSVSKEVSSHLLNIYNFPYEVVGDAKPSLFKKAIELPKIELKLYRIIRKFKPDLLIGGPGNVYIAHLSKITGIPSIIFDDTEHAKIDHLLMNPFASLIVTPACFYKDLGKKQLRYNGYHELAYLHPNYFKPNPAVLDEIGLSKDDTFIILRFVSWQASHDFGHSGLTLDTKRKAVKEFEKYGKVFITSESPLPKEFEKYKITVSPEKIHDLLYYATLLYGESATMASECAVLGTHAIFCDFAGRGYTNEEEEKYKLVFNFKLDKESQRKSLEKAVELLGNNNLKSVGKKKREKLLNEKINVTAFMVWFIENYPESYKMMKENPDIQLKFR